MFFEVARLLIMVAILGVVAYLAWWSHAVLRDIRAELRADLAMHRHLHVPKQPEPPDDANHSDDSSWSGGRPRFRVLRGGRMVITAIAAGLGGASSHMLGKMREHTAATTAAAISVAVSTGLATGLVLLPEQRQVDEPFPPPIASSPEPETNAPTPRPTPTTDTPSPTPTPVVTPTATPTRTATPQPSTRPRPTPPHRRPTPHGKRPARPEPGLKPPTEPEPTPEPEPTTVAECIPAPTRNPLADVIDPLCDLLPTEPASM